VLNEQPVTFAGDTQKQVSPDETFWSDPLTVDIPTGNYLVWTWTVEGEGIPATVMSDLTPTYAAKQGGQYIYTNEIPLPQLIGAKRNVKKRIVCLGDSITQGTGTPQYANAFWAADVAETLGAEYSLWNLGLGYSRASDCAADGDWLQRACHADIVTVAFGTNDMQGGQYGVGAPNAASAISTWISRIVTRLRDAGCAVILFNAPPFDLPALNEGIRTELNRLLPQTAADTGAALFDWCAVLENPSEPGRSLYGGHPDTEGCQKVAERFLARFGDLLRDQAQ
jgi:lysophospholipase L1-like esterase